MKVGPYINLRREISAPSPVPDAQSPILDKQEPQLLQFAWKLHSLYGGPQLMPCQYGEASACADCSSSSDPPAHSKETKA